MKRGVNEERIYCAAGDGIMQSVIGTNRNPDSTNGRDMKSFVLAAILLALSAQAAAAEPPAGAPVYEKKNGAVQSACQKDKKSNNLVCVVVYAKQPYLGVQLGSEDDSDSVAITAGARRAPNSKIEIQVDGNVPHFIYGDGFIGYEAEVLLQEIEKGKRASVRTTSQDAGVKTEDDFDLGDFNAALHEVEALRALKGEK
ncbi:MAG: hypothetical protein LAN18_13035 [Acidobacteriia bacterium]|nr:hypothetical protein [Terriglobia bacterium]